MREARIANGQSMKDLADLIGCSWQQVQKYEIGFNRVNGARFDLLVTALRRPMNYFFPNATDVRFPCGPRPRRHDGDQGRAGIGAGLCTHPGAARPAVGA